MEGSWSSPSAGMRWGRGCGLGMRDIGRAGGSPVGWVWVMLSGLAEKPAGRANRVGKDRAMKCG